MTSINVWVECNVQCLDGQHKWCLLFILSFCQLIKSFQIKDCLYESLLVLIMTNIFPFDKKWNQLFVALTSITTFTLLWLWLFAEKQTNIKCVYLLVKETKTFSCSFSFGSLSKYFKLYIIDQLKHIFKLIFC